MYVRTIAGRDFRCFERFRLDLLTPGTAPQPRPFEVARNINVLLGNNGAGKTSVLRAIALAVLGPTIQASGYRPVGLVRRAAGEAPSSSEVEADLELDAEAERALGRARLGVQAAIERVGTSERFAAPGWPVRSSLLGSSPVEARLDVDRATAVELERQLFDDAWPGFFVVGYGASRRVEAPESYDPVARIKSRGLRFLRVAGLFEEHFSLAPMASWFREASEPVRAKVARLLDELIPGDTRLLPSLEGGDVAFEHHGIRLAFHQLSDGYRAYVGWVADLIGHCFRAHGEQFDKATGVVLVDEVDLHLHPNWQRKVLPALASVFPRLQFVVTTHSPIVAGTIGSQNLAVLEWEGREPPRLSRPSQEVWGLSADQILTSDVFGLSTTRNPAFAEELRKVRETPGLSASKRFSRMLALGGAGLDDVADAPLPGWVSELARQAKGATSGTKSAKQSAKKRPKRAAQKGAPAAKKGVKRGPTKLKA